MGKAKKKHLLRIGFESSAACQAALTAMNHADYVKRGREAKLQLLQAAVPTRQGPQRSRNSLT